MLIPCPLRQSVQSMWTLHNAGQNQNGMLQLLFERPVTPDYLHSQHWRSLLPPASVLVFFLTTLLSLTSASTPSKHQIH